jgi:hypothetical protein
VLAGGADLLAFAVPGVKALGTAALARAFSARAMAAL